MTPVTITLQHLCPDSNVGVHSGTDLLDRSSVDLIDAELLEPGPAGTFAAE